MKTWKVAVTWEMCGYIDIEADNMEEAMKKFGLLNAKPVRKLPPVETIKFDGELLKPEMLFIYRSIIGSLLYICNISRPDGCFVVNFLSQFMNSPTVQHWKYAKQTLNYLHSTLDRKLRLGKFSDTNLEGYADASFGTSTDQRSQTGILATLYGSVVSWSSKKQDTVSKSTTEAEYIALSAATDEILWLKQLLIDWGMKFDRPTVLHEDNQAVIKLVHNGQINTRAKYLSAKLKFVHECIKRKQVAVEFIATNDQWADMLTKTKMPLDMDRLFQGLHKQGECHDVCGCTPTSVAE